MQAMASRPGPVDEPQRRGLPSEPPNQPVDVRLAGPDLPGEHRRIPAATGRMRDRDRIFGDIQPEPERCRLPDG